MNKYFYELSAKSNMNRVMSNNLNMPSEKDYEKIEYIKRIVNSCSYRPDYSFLPSCSFIEKNKAIDAIDSFYGREVKYKLLDYLCDIKEKQNTGNYYGTEFKSNYIPYSLSYPEKLSRISYIYIAHEYIHMLKDSNKKEFKNLYLYSEVLPIFEELALSIKTNSKKIKRYILFERINSLKLAIENLNETDDIEVKQEYIREYYHLSGNVYLLSYYYAVLLTNLFIKDQVEVLREIKKVLLNEKTTEELLNEYRLIKKNDSFDFLKNNNNLIRKCI